MSFQTTSFTLDKTFQFGIWSSFELWRRRSFPRDGCGKERVGSREKQKSFSCVPHLLWNRPWSNEVCKMNLFSTGWHNFWDRTLIWFGYVLQSVPFKASKSLLEITSKLQQTCHICQRCTILNFTFAGVIWGFPPNKSHTIRPSVVQNRSQGRKNEMQTKHSCSIIHQNNGIWIDACPSIRAEVEIKVIYELDKQ